MKEQAVDLFVFVDALGWDLVREQGLLADLCTERRPLESVLGYSCACIPTILTGLKPEGHGHFAFFRFDPERSPFKRLAWWLDRMPSSLASSTRVRGYLSRLAARMLKYTGYFQLYNMPFHLLSGMDYTEKRDLYRPGGILSGARTVFDELDAGRIPYHVSDWRLSEERNLRALRAELPHARIRAAYLYLAELDALLHREGTRSPAVARKVHDYDVRLRRLVDLAGRYYHKVRLHLFSDHGMADISRLHDLEARLRSAGLQLGVDYMAVLDSTMARLWMLKDGSEARVCDVLQSDPHGRLLNGQELARYGCRFPERAYGELIYLANPGTMIFPNFMGARPIAGMHGYDPDHPLSLATYLSTDAPAVPLQGLWDLKALMLRSVHASSPA